MPRHPLDTLSVHAPLPRPRRKNPAAVALGRRGGRANTEAQNAARRANGKRLLRRMLPCILCATLTTDRDASRRPCCAVHA